MRWALWTWGGVTRWRVEEPERSQALDSAHMSNARLAWVGFLWIVGAGLISVTPSSSFPDLPLAAGWALFLLLWLGLGYLANRWAAVLVGVAYSLLLAPAYFQGVSNFFSDASGVLSIGGPVLAIALGVGMRRRHLPPDRVPAP